MRVIPDKLRGSASPELAPLARKALDFLVVEAKKREQELVQPSDAFLRELQERLKSIYEAAFDCTASDLPVVKAQFEPIRVQIRRWIAQWDLQRHNIDTRLTVQALAQNLEGDDELPDDFEDS